MTPENRWQKYRQWAIVIVAISITVVLTALFLQLAPQYIPRFLFASLIGALIGLFFFALVASSQKRRVKLREFLMNYRARVQERGGLLYKYGRVFNAIMITILLALSVVLTYNPGILRSVEYIPYLVFAIFIVFLISAIIYIAALLRTFRIWGLILIIILTVIAILRIFILR